MYNQQIGVDAAADHSGNQYKAIDAAGAIAGTVVAAMGVLQNKPKSGEDAALVYNGRTKMLAGGAVAVGNLVGVNSTGYFVAVGSGTLNIGQAYTAAGSGGVFHGIVNFAGAAP